MLYPNALTTSATVSINARQHVSGTFTIVNSLGEAVQVYRATTTSFTIQRQNLLPGLYIGLYTATNNGETIRIKFVVQ